MKPTKNFLDYALYPAFFPALLAGPIDRANSFLPQIISPRKITLEKFYEGCYLIFWGLFQKLFIADNLSKFIVDPVFSNGLPYDGAKVLIALYGFVIQLYCDFAGYSNIAIGLGKLMGFEMMTNFNLPLFAVNVQDFWNRWHISLSTWVRDYVYIPFFLHYRNMKEKIRLSLAVMITMIIIGLWHGATWNFVVFGIWEGFILIIYQFIRTPIGNLVKPQSSFGRDIWLFVRIIFMFNITAISFSIFRAQSVPQIYDLVYSLLFNFKLSAITSEYLLQMVFFVFILVFIEIIQFRKNNQKNVLGWKTLSRTAFYFICYYLIIIFGFEGGKEFFYFQF